ncbi:MAG: LysR family transcriptional regulator [Pseudomonadota bacterium]
MDARPSWDLWQSFLAVVETGSLSAAARRLRLTQPTLSRHVDALEAALGQPLFVRGAQGLTPTPGAEGLLAEARSMAAAEAALRRRAAGVAAEETGVVRLSASEVVGAEVLPPILARFRAIHPGIVVELALSNRAEDVRNRVADLALRMFRPGGDALKARRLGTAQVGLFAHGSYLRHHAGGHQTVEDLARHSLIGPEDLARLGGVRLLGREPVLSDFGLRTDSDLAQLALVRAGAGIGVMQEAIAARHPDLVRVLPGFRLGLEVWLVLNAEMSGVLPVRRLADHLATEVRAFYAGA